MTDALQYPQTYLSAAQTAHRMVQEYTKKEVIEKASVRHVPSELPIRTQRNLLENIIAEEKYILEVSSLTLYPRKKLEWLASKLHIDHRETYDNVHLAWEIAMMIVRGKISYKFNKHRQLTLMKYKKLQTKQ